MKRCASLIRALDANGVICDDELSPAQLNNLETGAGLQGYGQNAADSGYFCSTGSIPVKVRSRSSWHSFVIVRHRLVGLRESLSRLGGGIGTRGPGEKKLETDRRLIRTRISALKAELAQVEKHRELIRGKRARGNLKTAAIVGYTNAGKSTLVEYTDRCRGSGRG